MSRRRDKRGRYLPELPDVPFLLRLFKGSSVMPAPAKPVKRARNPSPFIPPTKWKDPGRLDGRRYKREV